MLLCLAVVAEAQVFKEVPPPNNSPQLPSQANAPAPKPNPAAAAPATSPPTGETTNGAAGRYVADEKYKLRVGDKISFQILENRLFDENDKPKSLVIADSGEVDFPYIGRVASADNTCKQLTDEVTRLLEKDYYHQATVVLAVDSANQLLGRVYLWGQVAKPGAVEMMATETLTAGKAILRAGGFAEFANKKKVKVVRPAADGSGKQTTFELNMTEILENGRQEKDMVLQPDDFIIVSSRLINF